MYVCIYAFPNLFICYYFCKPSIRMRRVVGTAAISLRISLLFKHFCVYWPFFKDRWMRQLYIRIYYFLLLLTAHICYFLLSQIFVHLFLFFY
ncbi:hypothetical protein Hanom_Chr09g00836281 [Helianthus anomalus]